MKAEKIDLQEKLRSSNWKVQDMIDDIQAEQEKQKTTVDSDISPQIAEEKPIMAESPQLEIDKLTDEEVVSKYTVEDMMDLQNKPDKTESEMNLISRYENIVYGSYKDYERQVQEEMKAEYETARLDETVSEDTSITYGDLEKLAYQITKTLRDPKARF